MTRKDISDGVGNISTRHIQEAASYMAAEKKVSFFKKPFGRSMIAAVLALCILAGGISIFSPFGGMVVTAYAHGTDEEITQAGGSHQHRYDQRQRRNDRASADVLSFWERHFYCPFFLQKPANPILWTDGKAGRFGLAQNFTVSYGEDESEYYYLLIDWVPNATIRELTDNEDSTIAALPEEMRNDIIVMEITFENGKTLTKAITVSLLEDGTFFAKFDDYEITAEDSFIDRPDSEAIGAAPVIEDNYKEADPNEPEQIVIPNSITFSGTIIDNVIESLVPIILVDVEENSGLSYDKVLFELTEEQKDWELKIGTRVQIVCSDIFQESTPPIGNLISITEAAPNDELKIADEAARAYYENTVFEVVSLELKSQTENEISFSVCVSKGGIVQEPDRTIFLEFVNGHWKVVNEGY